MNMNGDNNKILLRRKTSDQFELQSVYVFVDGIRRGRCGTDELVEVDVRNNECELSVACGSKKSNSIDVVFDGSNTVGVEVIDAPISGTKRTISLLLWGVCAAAGFVLYPGLGGVIGFGVGYMLKAAYTKGLFLCLEEK